MIRDEVPAGPPVIGPVPGGHDRPTWSVMIPTYNASGLLEEVLRSVLDQDPGPGLMQIAVVDDCSPNGESRRIVERLAPGRVEYHQGSKNVGLAGNWNACVNLSRGRWVHLLHQDDLTFPGFYERLGRADADPSVGMAFCQHAFIDDQGAWKSISALQRRGAGIIEGWLGRICRVQCVQCPSVVVRRSVYEALGGYRSDLRFLLDWEMWVRIAARYSAWFEPTVLAAFRMHDGSETARLRSVSADLADFRKGMKLVADHLPAELRPTVGIDMIEYMSAENLAVATRLLGGGDYRAGSAQLDAICRFNPKFRFNSAVLGHRKWALKLWLRDRIQQWSGPRADLAGVAAGAADPGGVEHG